MKINEFLSFVIKENLFKVKENIYELFSIVDDFTLLTLKGDKLYLGEELISFYVPGEPLLKMYDKVKLIGDDLKIVDKPIETTVGKVLVNYLLLEWGLSGKIKYIEKPINLKKFVNGTVIPMLFKEDLTIEDHDRLSIAITYLRSLSRLFVVSDTKRTMLPPPNIDKLREAKIKELRDKYGEDALDNFEHLTTLVTYLQGIDSEWLKDDPTLGLITNNKIKNVSRTMKHLIAGEISSLGVNSQKTNAVLKPLSAGRGTDVDDVVKYNNSVRAGSFSRGNETKLGGTVSNIITKAMSNFTRGELKDCGTKVKRSITLNNDNILSMELRTGLRLRINDVILVRTPMECLLPKDAYCETCLGKTLGLHKNGIQAMALDVGGGMVDMFLAKMHGSALSMVELDLDDL